MFRCICMFLHTCKLMTDSLCNPHDFMSEPDLARYYHNIANNWYITKNNQELTEISKHLPQIIKLVESIDKNTRLVAIKTLSFITSCNEMHLQLFELGILKLLIYILGSSPHAKCSEVALRILTDLCTQSQEHKPEYNKVTEFCKNKQNLRIICRYVHMEEPCVSIIANVMSLFAALCTDR
eukprot:503126_1